MIRPTCVSEQLMFSTLRIQTEEADGTVGVGTGFVIDCSVDDDRDIPIIITNRHVVNDAIKGEFQLHEAMMVDEKEVPSGTYFTVSLDNFQELWIPHPDENVDLCGMFLASIRDRVQQEGKTPFSKRLTRAMIPNDKELEELRAIEEVVMVGYPIGLWDDANNLPIIRRGTTASHPAIDFQGSGTSVIDIACFPGSSGSPVLVLNEGSYMRKDGSRVRGNRAILLGVLFSGPVLTAEGKIVTKEIPMNQIAVSETNIFINLGYIVKAREILVLMEHMVHIASPTERETAS